MTEGKGRDPGGRELAPCDRPRRSETSEGEPAGEDYFVLDLDTGRYYSLGEVGGFIWQRLDGSSSLARIARDVTGAFDVDDRQAESDVVEFVGTLEGLGLIEGE
jgi:hypothetical protein